MSAPLGPSQVRARVEQIAEMAGDPEVAHGAEDDLHGEVLRAIAERSTDPWARAVAEEALKSANLDFARWCA